jgi:hypothetical protein
MTRAAVDVGSKLKRAREERGVSLREIATATKISIAFLEALERNDISRLPGGIFSRSFVRSYASEVGLDPEETVREFLAQFPNESVSAGSPHVPQEDHAAVEGSRQTAQTVLKLLAISLPVAAAILYLTVTHRNAARPVEAAESKRTALAPAPVDAAPAEAHTGAPSVSTLPDPSLAGGPPPAVGADPIAFEIVASAPVAVDVTVDGVRRESRTVSAGERMMVHADRDMVLKMSDAGAIQLIINGQPAAALGAPGEPRTVQISRGNYQSFLNSP